MIDRIVGLETVTPKRLIRTGSSNLSPGSPATEDPTCGCASDGEEALPHCWPKESQSLVIVHPIRLVIAVELPTFGSSSFSLRYSQ